MPENEPKVTMGDVSHSTFAIGSHARAESSQGGPARDAASEELLAAIRELRGDLTRMRVGEQTAELDTVLAETEEEIVSAGQAGPSRLQRLRQLLADSEPMVSLVSSAGSLAGLLGT
jgi:hypothetical protein